MKQPVTVFLTLNLHELLSQNFVEILFDGFYTCA